MKLFWAAVALMFSVSSWASLPPATFTDLSLRKISEAWEQSVDSFEVDVDPYPQPSAEAAYVWAVYLAHAFEQAGFSLEATLYKYLSESHAGSIQMHLFVQHLGLQNIIVSMDNPGYADAYLQAGAISQRVIDVADAIDPKAPIRDADFVIQGGSFDEMEGQHFDSGDVLDVGWIVLGEEGWEGWIIFSRGEFVSADRGIGIASISELSESNRAFYNSILDGDTKRKVKMQGKTFRTPDGRWYFDPRHDSLIKTL